MHQKSKLSRRSNKLKSSQAQLMILALRTISRTIHHKTIFIIMLSKMTLVRTVVVHVLPSLHLSFLVYQCAAQLEELEQIVLETEQYLRPCMLNK